MSPNVNLGKYLSTKPTDIRAKLWLQFSTNQGSKIRTFLGTLLFGTLILFSLVSSFKFDEVACSPFRSQPAIPDVSDGGYPGRSGEVLGT